jgi:serine/threonine protein kinase
MRRKSRTPCQSFGPHCQPLGDLSIRRRARCGFAASRNTAQSREPRGGWLTANPPRPRDAVAEALDYARQRGLLHRDVKPSNLLLANPDDGQQRILLADFGIARQLADISGLTATNLTVGTVAYAAPEQLIGLDIDGRVDQYALAVTAFHLLTGAPSFQHSKPVAVISQHLNMAPPALSDQRPDLARLDQVLSKALAKDPAKRFSRCWRNTAPFEYGHSTSKTS